MIYVRFWCVDYSHDLVPYSCINSASVINQAETVLVSILIDVFFQVALLGVQKNRRQAVLNKVCPAKTKGVQLVCLAFYFY